VWLSSIECREPVLGISSVGKNKEQEIVANFRFYHLKTCLLVKRLGTTDRDLSTTLGSHS